MAVSLTSDRRRRDPPYAAGIAGGFALIMALLLSIPTAVGQDGWKAAAEPGAVILMRHALAPGTGDPADFVLEDCATQRNLSEQGRDQARAIGEAFAQRGITIDEVLTSQWCRCRETAELLDLGPVRDFPAINSFFRDRSTAEAQTQATLDYLAALPDDRRTLLVTHQVNITALTEIFPRSGEAIVVEVTPDGEVDLLGRILIEP